MNKLNNYNLLIVCISILTFFTCTKGDENLKHEFELPTLNTIDVTNITSNSVKSGGININNKGSDIIDKGLCWSLNPNPTIDDFKLSSGNGIVDFNLEITNLDENTDYYIRAYATNDAGTGYGNELMFTTYINTPCSPPDNSIIFDSSLKALGGSTYSTIGLFYGDYGVKSNSLQGDLSIEFSSPPENGVYDISSDPFHMTSSECAVTGVFKIFGDFSSHRYTAKSGANAVVYVEKIGESQYSMTFCDLNFSSGSISFTFNGSNGNLTTTF
ncbi:hypothetical protein [Aestuariivivens insulae]|uniref:hypothetical protein n=1 Tax=Aestuariivivens insulae TaxID=1621988 RepID=UPI001F5754D8|nr:hypothetical protein [Aestuariivivens insulae]